MDEGEGCGWEVGGTRWKGAAAGGVLAAAVAQMSSWGKMKGGGALLSWRSMALSGELWFDLSKLSLCGTGLPFAAGAAERPWGGRTAQMSKQHESQRRRFARPRRRDSALMQVLRTPRATFGRRGCTWRLRGARAGNRGVRG